MRETDDDESLAQEIVDLADASGCAPWELGGSIPGGGAISVDASGCHHSNGGSIMARTG